MRAGLGSFSLTPLPAVTLIAALGLLMPACGDDAAGSSASASGSGGQTASVGSGGTGGSGGLGGDGGADVAPPKPDGLTHYLNGEDGDADVVPAGPALILMGGSTDVDAAFVRWRDYINMGDVVVLRTSGSDGYNDYLYQDIGGCDSVETLMVTSQELANDEYVSWRVRHAEGIFMAGGDQATYMTNWKDTALEDALHHAYQRGAVIGGTSAGCAVLGAFVFAAYNDTVYSNEALADPYNMYMQLDREFLSLSPLAKVITDTHFAERDRFGRLVGFVARVVQDGWAGDVLGIGVDERTALFVDPSGQGEVMGSGNVYMIASNGSPQQCQAGQTLEYADLSYWTLGAGDTVSLPAGTTSVPAATASVSNGQLTPANPY